uniref:Titin n=1 Tax=Gouania willdenowi TaxID=441366 RepID=A0A8C5DX10_GOUWI
MTLSWNEPSSDGGSPILGYHVDRKEKNSILWQKISKALVIGNIFKSTGLVDGIAYEYRVTAENMAGLSKPSKPSEPMYALDPIDRPGQPVALNITRHEVTVSWTKPEGDGGFSITGYTVERREMPNGRWLKANFNNILETIYTVSGLIEDATYEFRVFARNSAGAVSASSLPSEAITCRDDIEEPKLDVDSIYSSNVVVMAGEVFKLEANVTGRPLPSLVWTKEGKELEDTAKIEIKTTDFHSTLINKDSLRRDGGAFTLTASNPATNEKGVSDSRALNVPVVAKDLVILPTFKMVFSTFSVMAGDDLKIDVPYVACPKATAAWFKDGAILKETTRVNAESTDKNLLLVIKESCRDDVGTYTIKLTNNAGEASTDISVFVLDKPGPPTGPITLDDVTADSVVLSWSPPQYDGGCSINNYIVEKRDTSTTNWQIVSATVARTTIKAVRLKTGCEYQFRIAAENRYGKSSALLSEAIIAQYPFEVPSSPRSVVVQSATKETMVVVWDQPSTDGGSKILGYHLELKERNSILWAKQNKQLIPEPRFKVVGLEEGIEYEFRVYAENIVGLSKASNISEMQVARDPCDRPGKPEAVIVTRNQVTLRWTKPEYDAGIKITGYVVEKKEGSGRWMKASFANVLETEFVVTGLIEDQVYEFRVIARNAAGVFSQPSDSTGPVIARNSFVAPSPATEVMVSTITKDSMVVTWERPTNDGGSPIQGYVVEKRDKDGVRWTRCNKRNVSELRFRVTGLLESHSYEFRVSGENAAGVGTPSTPTIYYKALDPIFKPGPPNNPKVVDTSRSTVSLKWGKPIYDGGCEIQSYIVEACNGASDEWFMCTPPTGISDTKFTVKRLLEKHEYQFRVCAINKIGVGEHADVPGKILLEEKLESPDLELDADMRKMINIRSASTLRLFVPVRGRPAPEVKWGKADGEIKETAQIDNTGSYASLVIENVDRFDSGKYTLTAENAIGVKSIFISVRVLDSPSPPTNFIVKEITKNSVSLTWEPPLLDGGSKIKHYIVEKRESTRKVYSPVTVCNKMSWKVEPLPEGGIFFFRVMAENEYGVGLPVKTLQPIKISEKPQPPGKVSVLDVTKSTVTLTWEKPEHDGGSRISYYEVELSPKDSDAWTVCTSVKGLETVVTNLLKGEEYQFRIVAVNEKGKSDPRQLVQSVVTKDLVIEPAVRPKVSTYHVQVGYDVKIEVPVAGHPKPTITWTKDGAALKQTTRVNVTDSLQHTTLTIKDATKDDGGMYSINVANAHGSKDATIEVITLDRPGPPTGPVQFEDISAESITLNWEPPSYTGKWMKASFANVMETEFEITGLTEDNKYDFRVIARNAAGAVSKPSESTGSITAKDEVDPPNYETD